MFKVIGLVALAVMALSGCEEATGPVATEFLGTYELESFNGSLLPYTSRQDHTIRIEVLEGSITLDSGFGYYLTRSWRLTYPDSVRTRRSDLNGSYSVSAGQISFFGGPEGAEFKGTVNDSILTIMEPRTPTEPETYIEFRRSGY
jgi:hypothetical protein